MKRAAMPETPIHKHRQTLFPKNEVRLAKDGLIPTPASDVLRTKNANQRKLRVLIPNCKINVTDTGVFNSKSLQQIAGG